MHPETIKEPGSLEKSDRVLLVLDSDGGELAYEGCVVPLGRRTVI
jgi:hypothetical protein